MHRDTRMHGERGHHEMDTSHVERGLAAAYGVQGVMEH